MEDDQSQISDVPSLTEAAASEVHEQFRRAEADRLAAAAAQGAIPRGARGGAGGNVPGIPRGATGGVGGNVPGDPRGDQDGRLASQIDMADR
jgi:hypothetical protein